MDLLTFKDLLTEEGLQKIEEAVFVDGKISLSEAKLLLIKIRHLQHADVPFDHRLDLSKVNVSVQNAKPVNVDRAYKRILCG